MQAYRSRHVFPTIGGLLGIDEAEMVALSNWCDMSPEKQQAIANSMANLYDQNVMCQRAGNQLACIYAVKFAQRTLGDLTLPWQTYWPPRKRRSRRLTRRWPKSNRQRSSSRVPSDSEPGETLRRTRCAIKGSMKRQTCSWCR